MPSLRQRKRYIVFEIISDEAIKDERLVWSKIRETTRDFLGTLGFAKAGPRFVGNCWSNEKQKGIIQVNHDCLDHVRACLAQVQNINGSPVIVRSVGVSGILNKAKNLL